MMDVCRIGNLAEAAAFHHGHQFDLSGKPYFEHLSRVAHRLMELKIERLVVAGYFHDFPEDVENADAIMDKLPLGVDERVLIDSMKVGDIPKGVSYDRFYLGFYIKPMAKKPELALVKISDLLDNTDPGRFTVVDVKSIRRTHKYKIAIEYLLRSLEGTEYSLEKLRGIAPRFALEIESRINFLEGFCEEHSMIISKSGYEKIKNEFEM